MKDEQPYNDLKAGAVYHVTMEDCCVEGEFTSVFVRWHPSEDGTVTFYRAEFANGVFIGPGYPAQWKVEEVK